MQIVPDTMNCMVCTLGIVCRLHSMSVAVHAAVSVGVLVLISC